MTNEHTKIEQLMQRNAELRRLLAEIWIGRWQHAKLPDGLREAVGRALLPGREG